MTRDEAFFTINFGTKGEIRVRAYNRESWNEVFDATVSLGVASSLADAIDGVLANLRGVRVVRPMVNDAAAARRNEIQRQRDIIREATERLHRLEANDEG